MSDLVKVQFYEPDVGYENLWATVLPDGLYQIESVPFYVYGVSIGDIVAASPDSEGRLQFSGIVTSSATKTVRALTGGSSLEDPPISQLVAKLKALGCTIELRKPDLVAISIPPSVKIESVADFLTSHDVRWEYANPTFDDIAIRKRLTGE
jgi:hypothetical protein